VPVSPLSLLNASAWQTQRVITGVMGVGLLVLGVMLGGCSARGSEPQKMSEPQEIEAAPSPPGAAPVNPIPPVRNPKNLAAIGPCLLFTPVQLETNRIDQPGRPKDVLGSSGCEWGDRARTRTIAVFVDIGNDVLGNVYAQRDSLPVFELTQVAGYPAIRTQDNVDGTCYFRVATAEAQTLILRFTSLRQRREEACGPAKALAETVIGNLPPLAVSSPPA
jgi:Protein of unknown function (DUF3558)